MVVLQGINTCGNMAVKTDIYNPCRIKPNFTAATAERKARAIILGILLGNSKTDVALLISVCALAAEGRPHPVSRKAKG